MGLRDRREERRGQEGTQYQMRQKMFSIGDDYWIETNRGERAFKVDGKALRVRDTLVIEDRAGTEVCRIQEKMARLRDTMEIERGRDTLATVKKAMVTPLRDRYTVGVRNGGDMDVQGNITDHEYTVERDGKKVAEVSKRWFRVRDTYGVEVAAGEDDGLMLAVGVCLDRMSHD